MLLERLTNRKKILLIPDDIWQKIDLDIVGIPRSDNEEAVRSC